MRETPTELNRQPDSRPGVPKHAEEMVSVAVARQKVEALRQRIKKIEQEYGDFPDDPIEGNNWINDLKDLKDFSLPPFQDHLKEVISLLALEEQLGDFRDIVSGENSQNMLKEFETMGGYKYFYGADLDGKYNEDPLKKIFNEIILQRTKEVRYRNVYLDDKTEMVKDDFDWGDFFNEEALGRKTRPEDFPAIVVILSNLVLWYKKGMLEGRGFCHEADYLLQSVWIEMQRTRNKYKPDTQMIRAILETLEQIPETERSSANHTDAQEFAHEIIKEIESKSYDHDATKRTTPMETR